MLLFVNNGKAQKLFGNRIDYIVDNPLEKDWLPTKCIAVDINADGFQDIVLINELYTCLISELICLVAIFMNKGQGNFQQIASYMFSTENYSFTSDISSNNLNNDEYPDLVVTSDSLYILINEQGERFSIHRPSFQQKTHAHTLCDFDADSNIDIVMTKSYSDTVVSVLFNNGNADFSNVVHYKTDLAWNEFSRDIAGVDLDHNGYPDIILLNQVNSTVRGNIGNISIMFNTGNNRLTQVAKFPFQAEPSVFAIADLTNNGIYDIVIANNSSGSGLMILSGESNFFYINTFIYTKPYSFGGRKDVKLADFNRDEYKDIALVKDSLYIFINNGEIQLQETHDIFPFGYVEEANLCCADIDNDGDTDIITTNHGVRDGRLNGGFSVFFNSLYSVSIKTADKLLKPDFFLDQNYPNPFNPTTSIKYRLKHTVNTKLKIFNVLGKEVVTLVNENQAVGMYNVSWNGKDKNGNEVKSGLYYVQLKAGSFSQNRKIMLIR